MKAIRNAVIVLLVMILISAHLVLAQDLSKYRTFSLGTSSSDLSKQLVPNISNTILIHERPAVIQETTFWLRRSGEKADPVSEIVFSFYNGKLYRMVVIYDQHATEGLTAEDMIQAVSGLYGTATSRGKKIKFPTKPPQQSQEKVIARWEDSQNSVNLFHSEYLGSFGLVVLSKQMDADAEAAIIESVRLDAKEAQQKEIEREQKKADDLDVIRGRNRETFRP